uniref:Uncharacterized protein n=1 Tax=Anopheles dirus TaxID=7168 RepID=A0A182NYD5_9DIPT
MCCELHSFRAQTVAQREKNSVHKSVMKPSVLQIAHFVASIWLFYPKVCNPHQQNALLTIYYYRKLVGKSAVEERKRRSVIV